MDVKSLETWCGCRSFTLQVHSVKKSRTVRQVHIHYCAHPLAELSELKTRPDLWRKVCAASSSAKHTSPLHQQQTRLAVKQLQACLTCTLPAHYCALYDIVYPEWM